MTPGAAGTPAKPKLVCRDVWKIFGAGASEVMRASGGNPSAEDLTRHHLVGAVRHVDLEVREGERAQQSKADKQGTRIAQEDPRRRPVEHQEAQAGARYAGGEPRHRCTSRYEGQHGHAQPCHHRHGSQCGIRVVE